MKLSLHIILCIIFIGNTLSAYFVDLSQDIKPANPTSLGQGTNTNPQGDIITSDNRSFYLNGKPWMPVSGEFHYSRYPEDQWREELLKIKAGGIDIVPTYVFWIHHQERPGEFDFTGRKNLRRFVMLCDELGLLVIVRMGPWCHGEVRNGGLPDWVQNSGVKLRTTDTKFMVMVKPLYQEIAKQIEGLLWKDGGPVIGVQHDNERNDVPYLLELKSIARELGIDVPIYTMTGWNRVNIPPTELLPLFGAYSVAFWYPHSNLNFRKSFFFTDIRDDGDMGAQFENKRQYRSENIEKFPYVCCEIGGGMPSSYKKRVFVEPDEIAAMSMIRLGCGSNMQGYYMYHGGINPDGLTYLNEAQPNAMPVKDYDFQAPLGTFGQVREHYFLLRAQHMFIKTFQETLARMVLFLPETMPNNLDDIQTLRFSVRSDGNSGFIFFNNYQPETELPAKENVQFNLKTKTGLLNIPEENISIASGSYGIFPFNLDCDGVLLEYATVQPLCRLVNNKEIVYFFTSIEGIKETMKFNTPNINYNNKLVSAQNNTNNIILSNITPGTSVIANYKNSLDQIIKFIVLPSDTGKYLSILNINGKDHAIISKSIITKDGDHLRLFGNNKQDKSIMIYPAVNKVSYKNTKIYPSINGIFIDYSFEELCCRNSLSAKAELIESAITPANSLDGRNEEAWDKASVYRISIPDNMPHDKFLLNIKYTGNAARLYLNNKLYLDNYFNGKTMEVGLWNIPEDSRDNIKLRILPYTKSIDSFLPTAAKKKIDKALMSDAINDVTVETIETFDIKFEIQ